MKRIIISITLFSFFVFCRLEDEKGKEGKNCFDDGTCNEGLICNIHIWTCVKEMSCGNCGENAFCDSFYCKCYTNFGNCNNNWEDGCEIDFNNINSCGTDCNNIVVCSSSNGYNPICENGRCKLTCNNGYLDCNPYYGLSDGCEKQLDPKYKWSKNVSTGIIDIEGNSIAADSLNNIYIAINTVNSTIDFGGGELTNPENCVYCHDIFLSKFDSNGNHIWSKRYGGNGIDITSSIAIDKSNNIFITGYFLSQSINFGGYNLINISENCYGEYPCLDLFLVKLDSDGNHLWSKSFGGSGDDYGNSVSVDSSGNVHITGYFWSSTIDFGGGALKNASAGYSDIFLAKFDSNGNHLWSKRFGGSSDDLGSSVSVDSSGNVYITGNFKSSTIDFGGGTLTNAGGKDIYLAKFDSNGNHLWSKRFGGNDDDYVQSVSVDSSGNVYIIGSFYSSTIDFGGGALTNAGWNDIFLAKFDSDGNHLWSKSFGGSDGEISFALDLYGYLYTTGCFLGKNIDFGECPISIPRNCNIFLIKYAP